MKVRRILRKIFMFLVGINLLQPLRLFLDSSDHMFKRFEVSVEDTDIFLYKGYFAVGILSVIGTSLVCLYLGLLSPKFGFNHFNKLLTIITNWMVLGFDLVVLIIFTIGGQGGHFKVFFWIVVLSSFIFGINEAFLLVVDPLNIPFFMLGICCSGFQVVIYQLIYKATGDGSPPNDFKIILGQVIISFVLSVLVVGLCNYSYGGKSLFNIVGIYKMCDFMLDNSSKRLFEYYRKDSRYKKFLNEEIINEIKNLEYEIILRFNAKTHYKITNIIQTTKRDSKPKNQNTGLGDENGRKDSGAGKESVRNSTNSKADDNMRGSNAEEPEYQVSTEKVNVGVKVTSLRYENMLQGLEIYRHEVEKDVKLSRILGEFADIDVNLFHFKHADVFTKDKLTLINVVTVQFSSSSDPKNDIETGSSNDGEDSSDNVSHRGHHNPGAKHVKNKQVFVKQELGVYEMNYYFFVVYDRMYQYKPSENEWVHPVELLLSLIKLHKISVENYNNTQHRHTFLKNVGRQFSKLYNMVICHKKSKAPDERHDLNHNYNELPSANNKMGAADANQMELGNASAPEGAHGNSPNTASDAELCRTLRSKLIMLFLNNKLTFAIAGSILPLILCLLTVGSLFLSFPMMGVYDALEPATSRRFDIVIKIVSIIPGLLICGVCTVEFLRHFSMQTSWHTGHNYVYLSYLVYLLVCGVVFLVSKKSADAVSNNAFVLIMSLIIVVTFQINVVGSFTSLLFQKSSKLDYLTLNYLENNVKTNVQLMSFTLFLYHAVRFVYLFVYRKYTNGLFKLLYWVI